PTTPRRCAPERSRDQRNQKKDPQSGVDTKAPARAEKKAVAGAKKRPPSGVTTSGRSLRPPERTKRAAKTKAVAGGQRGPHRLLNWKRARAPRRPYFLRSFLRGSRDS